LDLLSIFDRKEKQKVLDEIVNKQLVFNSENPILEEVKSVRGSGDRDATDVVTYAAAYVAKK